MGDTHWRSNLKGKNGTETISNFATIGGTNITASGTVQGAKVVATSYLTVGSRYIFYGDSNTSASIVAEATALVATPIKGSMYMSSTGNVWVYKSDSAASPLLY